MFRRLLIAIIALALALATFGCAPRFHTFPESDFTNPGPAFYRASADANAKLSTPSPIFDTLLYSRKLNGGLGGQVVGSDRFIVVPTYNERVYFLNPANGQEITSWLTESAVGSAAALDDHLLYLVEEAGGDRLTCLNLVNGKVVFKLPVTDPPDSPVLDGETLYLSSRLGKVYCFNRWLGDTVWTYDTGAHLYCSPTVDSSQVYIGTAKGEVVCLSKSNGSKIWSFKCSAAILARPLAATYIYCTSADGVLYALDPATGVLEWSFTTSGAIHTTPVLVGNSLVFGSDDRNVYCINAQSGGELWSFATDGIVQSSPIATDSGFVVCNSAGSIYQFTHGGDLQIALKTRGSITARPTIIGNRLFVVTKSRSLYCFGSKSAATANSL